MNEKAVLLIIDSLTGLQEKPCRVVGETPKRYRVTVDQPTGIPPGFSLLMPGMTQLVPKHAVRFVENAAKVIVAIESAHADAENSKLHFP